MSHLRVSSTRNRTSVISSFVVLLLALAIHEIETNSSAEAEIPLGPSCTSADEFAAPAYGHCLPMQKCAAIQSGSNSPKFRLIVKALICETTQEELSNGENPKICCPDPRTNTIGGGSITTTSVDTSTAQVDIERDVQADTKTNYNDEGEETNDETGESSHEVGVENTTGQSQITVLDVTKIDMGEYTAKVHDENDDSVESDDIVQADDDKKDVEVEDDGSETKTGKSQEAFTSTNNEQEVNKEVSKADTSDNDEKTQARDAHSLNNFEEPQKNDDTMILLYSTNNNNEEKGQNKEISKSDEEKGQSKEISKSDEEKRQSKEVPKSDEEKGQNKEIPDEVDVKSTNATDSDNDSDKLIPKIHQDDVENEASHGVTVEQEDDENNTASEINDDENEKSEEVKSENAFETTTGQSADVINTNIDITEKIPDENDDLKVENPGESLNEAKTDIEAEKNDEGGEDNEENDKSHEVVDSTTDKAADATENSGITAKMHLGDDESAESRGEPQEDEVTTMAPLDLNNEPVDNNKDSNSSGDNNTEAELDGEGTHTVTETGLYHMDGSSQVEYEIAFGPTHLK